MIKMGKLKLKKKILNEIMSEPKKSFFYFAFFPLQESRIQKA